MNETEILNSMPQDKASDIRQLLEHLFFKYGNIYEELFLKGRSIDEETLNREKKISGLLNALFKFNILEKNDRHPTKIKSKYLIYKLFNCIIITDFHNDSRLDRVFPIYHENIYFSSKLKIPAYGKVLDLGFGSGIYSIISAMNGAEMVYATDINSKTKFYADINKSINNVENKIQFLIGDLFNPLPKNIKFDLICSNPPFLPIPPNTSYFLHSLGGSKGIDIIKKIIAELENWIKPAGCFQMICLSLGNFHKSLVEDMIYESFKNNDVSIKIKSLMEPLPLDIYIENLRNKIPYKYESSLLIDWGKELKQENLNYLHYMFVEATFGNKFCFSFEEDFYGSNKIKIYFKENFEFIDGIQWNNYKAVE